MKAFYKISTVFHQYMKRFFNRTVKNFHPLDIAKALVAEMEKQKITGVAHVYVPENYIIFMNAKDADKSAACQQVMLEEISDYLTRQADKRGYALLGPVQIEIRVNPILSTGRYYTSSQFSKPPDAIEQQDTDNISGSGAQVEAASGDTKVFEKLQVLPSSGGKVVFALLKVVAGVDKGCCLDLSYKRVNIGRREENELPLSDLNSSRLHAYVVAEQGQHVLYDARSLNGTFVNGQRIVCKFLQHGDRIKVGNTVISYELMKNG